MRFSKVRCLTIRRKALIWWDALAQRADIWSSKVSLSSICTPNSLTLETGFREWPDTWNSTSDIAPLDFKIIDWNFDTFTFMWFSWNQSMAILEPYSKFNLKSSSSLCRKPRVLSSVLVPSNIVACFRVALVRKKIPEFSWLHCGRRHLVSHVTVWDRTMACNFFSSRPTKFKWRSKCLNEVPVSPKSVSVLLVCLLLLLLAINAVNVFWHPHTPVLSTDEREIWAVKIVRSSCQRCKTWIFCIKISSIVWVATYEGSFVVLIYSINNKCIFMTCRFSVNVGPVNGLLLFTPSHCLNWC